VVRIEKIEDSLLVSVEDNGCGIRAEDLEKLFLPFFTTHADGNGLGLALCRKAVEASGGRMEVSSEVGVGSVFTLVLGAAIPKE
jgi:two-component system NtrC family sensor kinase